jgi:hypothetical protein
VAMARLTAAARLQDKQTGFVAEMDFFRERQWIKMSFELIETNHPEDFPVSRGKLDLIKDLYVLK